MFVSDEIVIKHYLGKIDFKTRTQNVEKDVPISKKLTFSELYPKMEEQKGYSTSYYNKALEITLEDIETTLDKKFIILMLNALDKKESTTVIKDKKEKVRQEFKPDTRNGQGYEHSCHIVISTESDKLGNYDILVEKVDGMPTRIINMFLDKVLFQISKKYEKEFSCSMPLSNEVIRYKPILEMAAKPDDQFISDINRGRISDIILINEKLSDIKIPDSNIVVKPKVHSLKLETSDIKLPHFDFLKKVGKFFSSSSSGENYNKIKVVYREPGSSKGGTTACFNASDMTQDEKDSLVTKKHILHEFKNPIKNSYEKINSEISDKMLKLF